jgi:hypothetical protein
MLQACDLGNNSEKKSPCVDDPALCTPLPEMLEMGVVVYQLCIECHREDGRGQAGQTPPVANSDYFMNNKYKAVHFILKGLKDSVFVNGQWYKGEMPPFSHLVDLEIASVLNYIRFELNDSITVSCDSSSRDANNFAVCVRTPRSDADRLSDTIAAWEVKHIRDSLRIPLPM